jgi:FAD/FMN-containing dehydrogenase
MNETHIQRLRTELRGELITPADAAYDAARKVYNAMIDRHPALIARCADVADVLSGVKFAREENLLLAVRGGGHNGPGLGICDGGLVIDLSRLRSVRVDPKNRTVRVDGGCLWGDVDHATHPFGLAVPSGFVSSTGVGGLTLGGGIGYLTATSAASTG